MEHHINYTPLKRHGRSAIASTKRFINNIVLGISLLFLFFSLTFLVVTLFTTKDQKISTQPRASEIPQGSLLPRIEYASLAEIEFIPTQVDNFTFNSNISTQIQQEYPSLNIEKIKELAINDILTWSALRNYYAVSNPNNIPLSPVITDVSYQQIKEEITSMENDYEQGVIDISGVFFKVRFTGVYPQNVEALGNKTPTELRAEAQKKIDEIIQLVKLAPDPAFLIPPVNQDYTVSLMNNGEPAEEFTHNKFDPPLFDDPKLFEFIKSLPLNEPSPVFTLTTVNPNSEVPEEYAYVIFYLKEKTGELPPLSQLVNTYIKNATIR